MVSDEIRDIVVQQKEGSDEIMAQAEAMEVATADDYSVADSFVKAIANVIKERKDFFGPRKKTARQGWQNWVDAEKEAVGVFEKAKQVISNKMSRWYLEEERKRKEEEARVREAAKEAGADESAVIVDTKPKVAPGASGQRAVWSIQITDSSKVPREFLIPDEAALTALAKQQKEAFNVPGVKALKRYARTR